MRNIALSLLAAAASACGASGEVSREEACVAGVESTCACDAGTNGTQLCESSGSYGSCSCAGSQQTGAGTTGASTGAAATTVTSTSSGATSGRSGESGSTSGRGHGSATDASSSASSGAASSSSGSTSGSTSGSSSGSASGGVSCARSGATPTLPSGDVLLTGDPSKPVYLLNYNNWGGLPGGYTYWYNDETCWGVTGVTDNQEWGGMYPRGAPSVDRGWSDISYAGGSSPFAPDWATYASMGIPVTDLQSGTKAHERWLIQAAPTTPQPTAPGSAFTRWDALTDVYLDTTALGPTGPDNDSSEPYYAYTDLQIYQYFMDNGFWFNATNLGPGGSWHSSLKTLGGVQFVVVVNVDGLRADREYAAGVEATAASCTVSFIPRPCAGYDGNIYQQGQADLRYDVGAIISWLASSNPTDDDGNPLYNNATGAKVVDPLISNDLFLTGINSGYEIDFTSSPSDAWITGQFWIATGSDPDGP